MKKLINILVVLVLTGCQNNHNFEVYFHGFTSQKNSVNIYFNDRGDLLEVIEPDEEAGWMMEIVAKHDDYFKVNIEDLNLINVWIRKDDVQINTRNYDGQKIPLFKSYDKSSFVIDYLHTEQTVIVLDAVENWVYIEGLDENGGKIKGWLEPDMQCGNPYTTCP